MVVIAGFDNMHPVLVLEVGSSRSDKDGGNGGGHTRPQAKRGKKAHTKQRTTDVGYE
jgi:hypothetical protein